MVFGEKLPSKVLEDICLSFLLQKLFCTQLHLTECYILQVAFVETHFQIPLFQLTVNCGLNLEAAATGWAKDFLLFMKVCLN